MNPFRTTLTMAALLAATAVHAARPLETDDAGVLKPRDCELEAGAARMHDGAGGHTSGATVQLGCGVGVQTQATLGAGRTRDKGAHIDAATLDGKTSLWRGDDDAGIALGYGAVWSQATGSWRYDGATITLIHTRPAFDGTLLHVNLGHARDAVAHTSATTWGLALESEGWHGIAPVAEIFGDDHAAPWWHVGMRYGIGDRAPDLDVSYGQQFAGGRPYSFALGVTWAF